MPILERDPWRDQYFEGVACPADVDIPTDDGDAYVLFPRHRWVYNKLLIAETQGLEHAPHGFEPPSFPVFSKPIYNMRGMGTGSMVMESLSDYREHQQPGHMWMALLSGEHVSTDVAVIDGEPVWWRHAIGIPLEGGMFDYWVVEAHNRQDIQDYCGAWLRANLRGYTGMANFETIGGRIIECHLRLSDQFPDLYGEGWVEALVALYARGDWPFEDRDRRDGFSVVLFGPHGVRYRHPDPEVVNEVLAMPDVSSVQVTFHEKRSPKSHAMPPGGFRLCIVNGLDLDTGFAAREKLALSFWATQRVLKRRSRKATTPQG